MDAAELRTGIDAQLVVQHLAGLVEGLQRFGLPAAAVQRDHQQAAHALAQRVLRDERGELGHRLLVTAQIEQDLGALFGGGRPELGEADPLGPGERPRHPGERRSVPFAERDLQRGDRPVQVTRDAQAAAVLQAPLENDGVDLPGVQAEHVPGAGRGQDLAGPPAGAARFQHPAQPGHVGVHPALGTGRGLLPPHGVDELIAGDDPVRPHGQHAQNGLLPGWAGRKLPAGKPGPDGSKDADAQRLETLGLEALAAVVHVIDGHRCLSPTRPFWPELQHMCDASRKNP